MYFERAASSAVADDDTAAAMQGTADDRTRRVAKVSLGF
jgi:hypothetical protein